MEETRDIIQQEESMETLVGLTNVFEGIASLRISQVKNQVVQSKQFFSELWNIYQQIRVEKEFHFGRGGAEAINKDLIIIVTAEGGFSGDIDEKLINLMLREYDAKKHDIIVIGHHGALRLVQSGVHFFYYFKLPFKDTDINVAPLVESVKKYRTTVVYYQTYVSLMVQDVKRIELLSAVQEQGAEIKPGQEEISERNYIFEPSTYAVVDHLEQSMIFIALEQVILESKLAQYASRFRAMSSANDKAKSSLQAVKYTSRRVRRMKRDARQKEVLSGLRGVRL